VARARRPLNEVEDPQEQRKRTFAAVRELLLKLAESRPVIVAIDDMQWADRDSLLLLDALLQPPRQPPLLLILTSRPRSASDAPDSTEHTKEALRVVAPGQLHRIDLGALEPIAAQRLAALLAARTNLGDRVNPDDVAVEAAGHPLYIAELVRHAAVSRG